MRGYTVATWYEACSPDKPLLPSGRKRVLPRPLSAGDRLIDDRGEEYLLAWVDWGHVNLINLYSGNRWRSSAVKVADPNYLTLVECGKLIGDNFGRFIVVRPEKG